MNNFKNQNLIWYWAKICLGYLHLRLFIIHIFLLRSCLWRCQFTLNGLPLLALLFAPVTLVCAEGTATSNPENQLAAVDFYANPTNGLGSWIWEEKTLDDQTCLLWKTFEIPASSKVTKARLVMTVDNEFTLYLDGRELGRGAEWRELFIFDLTRLLPPGRHVLAVQCYNGSFHAGMLLGLRVDLAEGRSIEVRSDKSWKVVPEGVGQWEKRTEAQPDWPGAIIIAQLGDSPWWTEPSAVNTMPVLEPIKTFFWQTGWFQISLLSLSGLVILISLRLVAQLALHRKERYLLQGERARIARDIHDDIGARMTQLVLHGELAQNELPDDSEARRQLGLICEEARGLLSTMDEILWAVNPQRDTLRDFAAYVCKYAQEFLKPTQIQCLFEVDSNISASAFNLPRRRSLLMAIKETLNNAAKHSEATELHLRIQRRGQLLVVVVEDNGKGFDPAAINTERNGLFNMSRRMSELGGNCVVTSQKGKGCRIEFSIPLNHSQWRPWIWLLNIKKYSEEIGKTRNSSNNEHSQNYDSTRS